MKWMVILIGVGLLAPLTGTTQDDANSLSTVSLDETIVFSAPDGSPVKVAAGTYAVENTTTGDLQLVSADGSDALVLRATIRSHDEDVDDALALLISAEDGSAKHLVLLLPDGKLAEAVGNVGGVTTRGTLRLLTPQQISSSLPLKQLQRVYPITPNSEGTKGLLESGIHSANEVAQEDKAGSNPVLVHPAGTLDVRQKVQPLELQLDKFGNASVMDYQSLSPTVKASMERPDAEMQTAAMRGLVRTDRNRLERVVLHLRVGNQNAGQREWQSMISQMTARPSGASMDINSLIQYVLRQSYLETIEDLRFYAEKVRFFNELKQAIRNELTEARKQLSSAIMANPNATDFSRPHTVQEPLIPTSSTLPLNLSYRKKTLRSRADWEAYIEKLEELLSTIGDDAQLANIDLQNILQKQQQTLQTMSNVSKMLHDTAMAIVRKIG